MQSIGMPSWTRHCVHILGTLHPKDDKTRSKESVLWSELSVLLVAIEVVESRLHLFDNCSRLLQAMPCEINLGLLALLYHADTVNSPFLRYDRLELHNTAGFFFDFWKFICNQSPRNEKHTAKLTIFIHGITYCVPAFSILPFKLTLKVENSGRYVVHNAPTRRKGYCGGPEQWLDSGVNSGMILTPEFSILLRNYAAPYTGHNLGQPDLPEGLGFWEALKSAEKGLPYNC